ncbi:NADH-quinone oxidoreductase subunit H 1 [Geothrix oryzae]|uniref:NADH-quinone oxidoreductase subunit H n=1 Tax=Geothrix oryzae TaxID=2927975 RepID=A0ABN6V1X2_9BACT|nr:NADH-quinone oxidoreductase subunit H [Geothrix oryzae]BDU70039.1 NADH-quinone oxidoreductase subunit H 1 [Geothrix oryzae]
MPTPTLTQSIVITLIQCLLVVIFVFVVVPLTVFAERKVLGHIQQRLGSTRVASGHVGFSGWMNRSMWKMGRVPVLSYWRGIPGLVGDVLKLILKEDVIPAKADRFVFFIAPSISMVAAIVVFAAISFVPGTFFTLPAWFPFVGGLPVSGGIADINVGLLWILGVATVGVYGIVLAGWSSNSKYPLLGGLRSAAQMVSYEVPLALSLLAPVVLSASLNFGEMSARMATGMPVWALVPQVIGFLLYLTCGFAETNRLPFDMPEAENELVAGFHTEYSGMKFGLFYLAEYINMAVVSALASAFFLGGPWLLPFGLQGLVNPYLPGFLSWFGAPHAIFFVAKIIFLLFTYIWVRGTIPRYRYDQIMAVGWKYLIPLALINLLLAAAVRCFAV